MVASGVTDSPALRFERRRSRRAPLAGSFMGLFADQHGPAVLARVELLDCSDGGLGLRCPVAVQPGQRVSLFSRNAPVARGTGTVARCVREGEGYRVGLRSDRRLAA